MRRSPGRHADRVGLFVIILLTAPLAAGCLGDEIEQTGPLTLVEAHDLARPAAQKLAPSANLVAFVGHEGPAPTFLRGLLAAHYIDRDTSDDPARADGRAKAWALLFATQDGGLVRVNVHDEPREVRAEWASRDHDALLQTLWALNLGGRLLVDSPRAVDAVLAEDAAVVRHLKDAPLQNVVYASTVTEEATVDGDAVDLAYELFFDYGTGGKPYAFFAQVSHFSGKVVATGDHASGEKRRTVTLVDESFSLGPVMRTAEEDKEIPEQVYDAFLRLQASGNGGFVVEVLRESGKVVARIEEPLLAEPTGYESALGTLVPGTYRLRAEATGSVSFDLEVEGVIGL